MRQLELALATVEERAAAARKYLQPLAWPRRQVEVLVLLAARGVAIEVDGQRGSSLAISRAAAAAAAGVSKNTFARGVEDLSAVGLVSVNRGTQPWLYSVNWDRVAQWEPPEAEPAAAEMQNLFGGDWSPPGQGRSPGGHPPVSGGQGARDSVSGSELKIRDGDFVFRDSVHRVTGAADRVDRGDRQGCYDRPWDRQCGVDDATLRRAVAQRDVELLERMFEVAVELGWLGDSEEARLRFYTIVHHAATSAGLTRSRMGNVVSRLRRGLDVERTRQASDRWAAELVRWRTRNPELIGREVGKYRV